MADQYYCSRVCNWWLHCNRFLQVHGMHCGRFCKPAVCLACFCEFASFIALALVSLQSALHLFLRKFASCITIAFVIALLELADRRDCFRGLRTICRNRIGDSWKFHLDCNHLCRSLGFIAIAFCGFVNTARLLLRACRIIAITFAIHGRFIMVAFTSSWHRRARSCKFMEYVMIASHRSQSSS